MGQYTYYCPACDVKVSIVCSYASSLEPKKCPRERTVAGRSFKCDESVVRDEIADPGVMSVHADKAYRPAIKLEDGRKLDTPAAFKNGLLWY